ncbi:hypothetical protein UB45_19780 [Terrabacter sp. 28]|nr:hypothetical protein UB45_19780 [Terrabacter sp. 28]
MQPEVVARTGAGDGADDRVGRYVVRVRRLADLSQRGLAEVVGTTASTVCRIESGASVPTLGLFEQILAVAGLKLAVVDADGCEVMPVPEDLVRDNQGRRFPAHLDLAPPDEVPYEREARPRYDRPQARAWFRHRAARDREAQAAPHRQRQVDHPTRAELRMRARLRRGRQPVVDAPPPSDDCTCPDTCFEAYCAADCPCQCEPGRDRFGRPRGAEATGG